ncbi:MAG: hypothetical protein H0X42_10025 [Solirubrobacterales bacterium]|nr:hypothetical protein [Solirubrobacterales bacterium]
MRRRLLISALLTLAVLLGAGVARAELSQVGDLRISFDGGFTPRALPREKPASVTVSVEGAISTTDGTQPPPLRELEFALNRAGRISTAGLPECTSTLLQSTTSEAAMERCGPALVGHGSYSARLASSQTPVPVQGKILAFNGTQGGKPALILHLYGKVPVRATFVVPLKISHRAKGRFGTVLSARIPILAGGVGSITAIKLKLGREYSDEGQRVGYISASCAAPTGFTGATFTFARGSFHFADGRVLHTPLVRNCRVR